MAKRTRIGVTMMLAGTASLTLGVVLSPSAGADAGGQNICPEGTTRLVKFEAPSWNKEPDDVTSVTLVNPTLTGGSWTSTVDIAAVVLKGGSGDGSVKVITDGLPGKSGSYSNAGMFNNGDQVPAISHIDFCTGTVTTTSSGETTTTTSASTTTTEASTTTTTAAATTTTEASTTTTAGAVVEGVTETKTVAPAVGGVQQQAELPRTGASADLLISFGVILLLTGLILMSATRGPAWRSGV